jgi:hypothetical protein
MARNIETEDSKAIAVKEKKQTSWKMIYTRYEGIIGRAMELLNKEAGRFLIREEGKYTLHVLPMEQESLDTRIEKNAFILGCYDDSCLIQKYVSKDEIPDGGYLLKVIDNPDNQNFSFVILTGNEPQNVFYAAEAFLNKYARKYSGIAAETMAKFLNRQWIRILL